jgi:hypothetical protein
MTMARTVARTALALAFAAGLLTGCDHSSDGAGVPPVGSAPPTTDSPAGGPAGGPAPDPCELVTTGEVEAAAGAEVIRTQGPDDVLQGRQCEWIVPHDEFGEDGVVLNVWVGPEFYAPDGPGAEMTGFEPVDGLGDVAHMWPRTMLDLCGVIFMQDEVVVQVNLTGEDEACLDLARAAAGRL